MVGSIVTVSWTVVEPNEVKYEITVDVKALGDEYVEVVCTKGLIQVNVKTPILCRRRQGKTNTLNTMN